MSYKKLVRRFIEDILVNMETDKLENYIHPEFHIRWRNNWKDERQMEIKEWKSEIKANKGQIKKLVNIIQILEDSNKVSVFLRLREEVVKDHIPWFDSGDRSGTILTRGQTAEYTISYVFTIRDGLIWQEDRVIDYLDMFKQYNHFEDEAMSDKDKINAYFELLRSAGYLEGN